MDNNEDNTPEEEKLENMGEHPSLETGQFDIGQLIKPGDIERGKTEPTPGQMKMLKQQIEKDGF